MNPSSDVSSARLLLSRAVFIRALHLDTHLALSGHERSLFQRGKSEKNKNKNKNVNNNNNPDDGGGGGAP